MTIHESAFSSVPIKYYTQPNYGRFLARGAAGQKLTREGRDIAFGGHCAEVDACCCHPRLLKHKLQALELWPVEKYMMIEKFTQHPQAWRQIVADYAGVSLKNAKAELIRLFYGGKPSLELPFLRKWAADVSQAAQAILQHPASAPWENLYGARNNPEFSRLSEAEVLSRLRQRLGDRLQTFIFDGGYVRCQSFSEEVALHSICHTSASGVQLVIKSWPALPLQPITLPRRALREGLALVLSVNGREDLGNCLLNSINCVCPEYEPSVFFDVNLS